MITTGIHYDIPFKEYQEIDALNASRLEWGEYSMEHMKAAIDGKMHRDSPAMTLGRAIHARLLEPDLYQKMFQVASPCEAVIKSGQRRGERCNNASTYYFDGQWFCGTHCKGQSPAENVLSQADANTVEAIAEKVKQHKVIRLLRQRGGYEATAIWELEGERCKGRYDKLIPRTDKLPPVIIDLKKCRMGHARTDMFEKAIRDYRYDVKAAWYCDGLNKITGDPPLFVWIAVEDEYPHGLNVIQADRATINVGRIRYRKLFADYLRAKQSGQWQGYTNEIVVGGLPEYMKYQYLGGT